MVGTGTRRRPRRGQRLRIGATLLAVPLVLPGIARAETVAATPQASDPVVVVLADQHSTMPAWGPTAGLRAQAITADQGSLADEVRRAGGNLTHEYQTLNAFAAWVTPDEKARLEANPAVRDVVDDQPIMVQRSDPLAGAGLAPSGPAGAAGRGAGGAIGTGTTLAPAPGVCPSDPAHPLLEPEALQVTRTAFPDPSVPQARRYATGAGVQVAFLADGLDTNNPDFIRPDGSPVFVDYVDFTGSGPSAPTDGTEAFGDASSIAAQGRQTYDLAGFVNPAHPLPAGCTIRIEGIAPGASLVGIKVLDESGSGLDSVILQGLDYAVAVRHVDVINESLGANLLNESAQDAFRLFDRQAVAAGVTVVASTGDAGPTNTIGNPADDPAVIGVGGTTTYRFAAQTNFAGYPLATGRGWVNDNAAPFSSSGFTLGGGTLSLVAPGDAGWALCSRQTKIYQGCLDFAGRPSPIQEFAGTSESSPIVAGTAALVIQAYRDTHGGRSPTPALVKEILTSTADDLDLPGTEQGAGRVDALAAVETARSVTTPDGPGVPTSGGLLVTPGQLDLSGLAGAPADGTVTVTNTGAAARTVRATTRQLTVPVAHQAGTVTLDPTSDPTFVDSFGIRESYRTVDLDVPPGTDRLAVSISFAGSEACCGGAQFTLTDPNGNLVAYSDPDDVVTNHGYADVRAPSPGQWHMFVWAPAAGIGFFGPVDYDARSDRFTPAGTVSPAAFTLPPGASATVHVHLNPEMPAGDHSQDLVLSDGDGGTGPVVPIVARARVPVGPAGGEFAGVLTGGNGDFGPADVATVEFDVPPGVAALSVAVSVPDGIGTEIVGLLTDAHGQAMGVTSNTLVAPDGTATSTPALQSWRPQPDPGRWRYSLFVANPVSGITPDMPYTGSIAFTPLPVAVAGVPDDPGTVLPAGVPVTATLTVDNTGAAPAGFFADARLDQRVTVRLVPFGPATHVALPLAPSADSPEFLVPTGTTQVVATVDANRPITFDVEPDVGDPEVFARGAGRQATATVSAPELTAGFWFVDPALRGPFAGPASGRADVAMTAQTPAFDRGAASTTGDYWLGSVDPNAPTPTPVLIPPAGRDTIGVTFTPKGKPGTVVSGTLHVAIWNNDVGTAQDVAVIPYRYQVGTPPATHHRHQH